MNKLDKLIHTRESMLRNGAHTFENIHSILFSEPSLPFMEYEEDYRTVKVNYGEADQKVRELAAALSARIGADAIGSYVALEMENCPEWLTSFWALLMAGYKPLLINCKLPQAMTDKMVESVNARFVLSMNASNCKAENVLYSSLEPVPVESFTPHWENELALCTTATSLSPKLCVYTGEQISAQIMNTHYVLNTGKRMKKHYHGQLKQLVFLPFYHVFGLFATYFWFAFFGRCFVFLPDYSGETILRTVRKHEVTHIFAVPLLWHTIEKEVRKSVKNKGEKTEKKFYKALSISEKLQNFCPCIGNLAAKLLLGEVRKQVFGDSICFLISGGSHLRDDCLRLFNALGYSLHVGYGMSEIGICSVELREKPKQKNQNSIGRHFPSVRYEIDGGGDEGELLVSGDSLCVGYYLDGVYHERQDGAFRTGDLVRRDKKDYYFFASRTSELIIGPSGENVSPDEIESRLDLPYARRFCVLGLGQAGKEEITLIAEVAPTMPQVQRRKLLAAITEQNSRLTSVEKLQKIFFTTDPIASENAIKVSRTALKRLISSEKVKLVSSSEFCRQDASEQSDLDDIGLAVRAIFAEVLNRTEEEVGADDHFIFDLGGNSLEYFTLQGAINERFDIRLQTDTENCRYTVAEIAKQILDLLK